MNEWLALGVLLGYFAVLLLISWWTSRGADTKTFFTANRNSPWYVVAFGMIGASLSGVTFVSVPGAVGNNHWYYFQMVLGYLLGYAIIAMVLLPLYYRLKLVSIYEYLKERFGRRSYESGAVLFLVSRVIGASLRLFIVARVLHLAIFEPFNLPFEATVLISIALIYLYTFRGGIKTVVWTDTLQTLCMLTAAGLTVYLINQELDLSFSSMVDTLKASPLTETWVWDWQPGTNFFKQFFSGAAIAVVMTGLDQDMMQKNLTIKTVGEAQQNVVLFSAILVLANLLFLSLGALLYIYGATKGIVHPVFDEACKIQLQEVDASGVMSMVCHPTDDLFPYISLNHLGPVAAVIFLLGIVAAAYSSADSALTALTTSFSVDILHIEDYGDEAAQIRLRMQVHVGFAAVLFFVIVMFNLLNDDAVIWAVFKAAGYTYGPLLGMFTFGLLTKWKVHDEWVPLVCIISPALSYGINLISPGVFGYEFGFEILILNGLLTFVGMMLIRDGRV